MIGIAPAAQAFGPGAVRLLGGGGWMGQSLDYKNSQLLDPDRKFWLTGGVSMELGVFGESPLSLEVGAMYIQKGMQFDVAVYDGGTYMGTVKSEPNARYLSFPVLLRYTLGRSFISPYVVAGPTLEVLLEHDDFLIFNQMDSANLGLQLGIGAEIGNFGASLRYMRDLNNPYNKPADIGLDPLDNPLESVANDGILALVTFKLWGR
jgi:hypothetical protein